MEIASGVALVRRPSGPASYTTTTYLYACPEFGPQPMRSKSELASTSMLVTGAYVVTTEDATLLAVVVHASIATTPASRAQPTNSRTKKESRFGSVTWRETKHA